MYVKLYKWTNELKAIIKLHDNYFLVQIKQKITILPQNYDFQLDLLRTYSNNSQSREQY